MEIIAEIGKDRDYPPIGGGTDDIKRGRWPPFNLLIDDYSAVFTVGAYLTFDTISKICEN